MTHCDSLRLKTNDLSPTRHRPAVTETNHPDCNSIIRRIGIIRRVGAIWNEKMLQ